MKTIITFLLCVTLSLNLMAAETLSFKFANPRITFSSSTSSNYLNFDVLLKATNAGTYLYASQVICNVSIANFNIFTNPIITQGFIGGIYDNGEIIESKYSTVTNWNSGNLNIFVIPNYNFNGSSPSSGAYSEVTTSWQTLVSVRVKISDITGIAGISFKVDAIDGYQTYATGVSPYYSAEYNSPNLYEGYDFTDLYLGRIFSGGSNWTQAGGVVDWNVPVNTSVWDTTTTAAVAGSATVLNAKAGNLTIHPTARLVVPAGRSLTCSGNSGIKEPHGLVLGADATGLSQFIDNGTINYANGGSVEVQNYLTAKKWHYYSIPLESTIALPYLNVYMKYYKESVHNWKYVHATDSTLNTQMLGYAMWAKETDGRRVSPRGMLNTGTISATTKKTGTDGYNLVGNPYPSAIDLSLSGVNWSDCQQKAWFFDPAANNYKVYIKAGGGTRASSYCVPQQGFFVLANSTTSFGVNNSIRTINSESFLKNAEALPDMLELTASCSENSFYDKAIVRFASEASTAYDNIFDAFKLTGGYEAPQLYSILNDLSEVSVNTRPWTNQNEVVPLGFQCGINATYTISAENMQSFDANISVYLEDKILNNTQNLRNNPFYSFSASEGEALNRFYLHITNTTAGVGETIPNAIQIYNYEGILYVKNMNSIKEGSEIFVFDMLGRKVFQNNLHNDELNAYKMQLLKGYYLVKVVSGNSIKTEKILF